MNNAKRTLTAFSIPMFVLAILFGLLHADAVLAATIPVNSTADNLTTDGTCTLREAIMNANSGGSPYPDCIAGTAGADIVSLPAGTYTLSIPGQNEDANTTGDLDITDDLTITGAGAAATRIQAGTNATNGIDRVFHVVGAMLEVTLDGLTVRWGMATSSEGGGIYAPEDVEHLTFTGLTITENTSDEEGGGVYVEDPLAVTIEDCKFEKNTATEEGGGLFVDGSSNIGMVDVTGSTFTENSAGWKGGGIYLEDVDSLRIASTVIDENSIFGSGFSPAKAGGGIYLEDLNTAELDNVTVTSNTVNDGNGGGIWADYIAIELKVYNNSTISGNKALKVSDDDSDGGGLYVDNAKSFVIEQTDVSNNTANRLGGGIHAEGPNDGSGTVHVSGATFSGNVAGAQGGGLSIHAMNTALIENTVVDNNSVNAVTSAGNSHDDGGGGILLYDIDIADLNNVTVTNNTATDGLGGGIWAYQIYDELKLRNRTTISGNTATAGADTTGDGGGLWVNDTTVFVMEQSEVLNNTAARDGGGIYYISAWWSPEIMAIEISNSTIDGNTSSSGGGIFINNKNQYLTYPNSTGWYTDIVTIFGSTISNNSATGLAADTSINDNSYPLVSASVEADCLGSGGGIFLKTGKIDFTNTTISGNAAANNGGGIFINDSTYDSNIRYTTIALNNAGGKGGGIHLYYYSNGYFPNDPPQSFRQFYYRGNIQTTIVANNTAAAQEDDSDGPDCYNGYQDQGSSYNLITILEPPMYEHGSCGGFFGGSTDIAGEDPLLGPLQDNGGPTKTHALAPDSPAISQVPQGSHGCGTEVIVDQRVQLRPGTYAPTDQCEMGAWEAQALSLGDRVWYDTNQNGIQDAGEPGVEGITVALYDNADCSDDPVPLAITTAVGGLYEFSGLAAGTYCVQFGAIPAGWQISPQQVGGDPALDSDADPADGRITAIGLTADDDTRDMGIFAAGTIGNTVWCDDNRNGDYDPGEGIDGVTVNLFADSGCDQTPDGPPVDSRQTANDGQYQFENVEIGPTGSPTCYLTVVDESGLGDCNDPLPDNDDEVVIDPDNPVDEEKDFGYVERAAPVPTLSEWGMVALALLMALMGAAAVRRRV